MKQSNKEFNNKNKPLPKVDVEFGGDNGLEDIALSTQKNGKTSKRKTINKLGTGLLIKRLSTASNVMKY